MSAAAAVGPATQPAAPARKRPRVFYLDLIRALATLLIVLTHFNFHLRDH